MTAPFQFMSSHFHFLLAMFQVSLKVWPLSSNYVFCSLLSTLGDSPSQGRPLSRRIIATKLRHFAQTTSPNAAAAASPGKQLPIGSTHRAPPPPVLRAKRKRTMKKHFWVKISRKLVHTKVAGPPLKRGRGRPPLHKPRPKPAAALSSVATMKRARSPSPLSHPPSSLSRLQQQQSTKKPQAKKIKLKRPRKNNDSNCVTSSSKIHCLVSSTWNNLKSSSQNNAASKSLQIEELLTRPLNLGGTEGAVDGSGLRGDKICSDMASANNQGEGGAPSCMASAGIGGGGGLSEPLPPAPPLGSDKLGDDRGSGNMRVCAAGGVTEVTREGGGTGATTSLIITSSKENSNLNATIPGSFGSNEAPLISNGIDNEGHRIDTNSRSSANKMGVEVEVQEGMSLLGGSGRFEFDKLFSYYPPKLVLLDGDLCPERSLSVCDMERSKLNSLPPDHPFLGWSLGQPTTKPNPPAIKPTRKNKIKSKTLTNLAT